MSRHRRRLALGWFVGVIPSLSSPSPPPHP
uniref:Uncharacterized protein n=1 Tax=Arundo donax TaxID=35708 RepID=A0A0A8ZR29_ARUDO